MLVSIWARSFDAPPAYRMVDIKALGNFNFDGANGTIDDVPSVFRRLDGAHARDHRASVDAGIERELDELVRVGHELRVHDARDAKVDAREIVD